MAMFETFFRLHVFQEHSTAISCVDAEGGMEGSGLSRHACSVSSTILACPTPILKHTLHVCHWIAFSQFPEHPYGNLAEKLLLFRHSSNNSLVPLRDKESIRDGEIIEIVLSGTSVMCSLSRGCIW